MKDVVICGLITKPGFNLLVVSLTIDEQEPLKTALGLLGRSIIIN